MVLGGNPAPSWVAPHAVGHQRPCSGFWAPPGRQARRIANQVHAPLGQTAVRLAVTPRQDTFDPWTVSGALPCGRRLKQLRAVV